MSYLYRSLKRSIQSLEREPTWYENVIDDIDYWWHHCALMDFWYRLRWVWTNRWLIKHIWSHRAYSARFSLELLCDSLEQQAQGNKNSWSVHSRKQYRRAMCASGLIRRAYLLNEDYYNDIGYYNLRKNNPVKRTERGLEKTYYNTEEYYKKMDELINNRLEKWRKQREKDAWDYFMKYFYKFGD